MSRLPVRSHRGRALGVAPNPPSSRLCQDHNQNAGSRIALEAREVLRAGLETSPWVSVDDTGARHKAKNGFCTQIGNDWFTWFATRSSKTRLNFLDLLRAGHSDYVLNAAAFDYLRSRGLPGPQIARLAEAGETRFIDQALPRQL